MEAFDRARLVRARAGVAVVFGLNGFGYGSWVPRIAEIQDKVRLSDGELGLALFMVALGALLGLPIAGAAAHRYGSRSSTATAVVLYGLSLPGLALPSGPVGLGVALFYMGAVAGVLDVSMNTQGVAVESSCGDRSCRRCTACSASARWPAPEARAWSPRPGPGCCRIWRASVR